MSLVRQVNRDVKAGRRVYYNGVRVIEARSRGGVMQVNLYDDGVWHSVERSQKLHRYK